ncbi:MAG: hypothetical protein UU78_C0041G0001, partial [Candidatus Roizmanbacteria bacterium GW2011_GWC2_41_7]
TAEWYYKQLSDNAEKFGAKMAKADDSMLDDHELWKDSTEDPEYQQEFLRKSIFLMNTQKVTQKITEILQFVPGGKVLQTKDDTSVLNLSDERTLLEISPSGIEIPETNIAQHLFDNPSPLHDDFVAHEQINESFGILLPNKIC